MTWIALILAGLLEVVWAVGLKYTEGFTRPLATAGTLAAWRAVWACWDWPCAGCR
jgi:quaternary ammonium compound-resistance protein SugE